MEEGHRQGGDWSTLTETCPVTARMRCQSMLVLSPLDSSERFCNKQTRGKWTEQGPRKRKLPRPGKDTEVHSSGLPHGEALGWTPSFSPLMSHISCAYLWGTAWYFLTRYNVHWANQSITTASDIHNNLDTQPAQVLTAQWKECGACIQWTTLQP